MNQALEQLDRNQLAGFVLVLARVGPLFLLAPPFSSSMVPIKARVIVAVALAVGLAPLALHGQQVPADAMRIAGLALKEIVVGLGFALSIACLFGAFAAAGSMIDTQMGFNFGSLVDPITNQQGGSMNQVYSLVAVAVFIAIDGEAWVIRGLARTYELVPLLETPSLTRLTASVSNAFVGVLGSALEIAAPVLLALILTDVAFGVVSRVVPQLNVFAVGFPMKIIVGLLVVAVSLPFLGGWLFDQLQLSVESGLSGLAVS